MPCQPRSGTPPPLTLPGAPPGRAVAPTPQLVLGQTINLAEHLALHQAQSLRLLGIGMEGAHYGQGTISDGATVQLVITALNQPTTVVASATGADRLIEVRSITLVFNLGTTNVSMTYNPQRQTIEWFAAQPQFTVAAPPGFLEALTKIVCNT